VLGSDPVARLQALPLPDLCDQLLEALVPGRADDDIALLAVRVLPEGPRPDQPGPDEPPGG
jgi:hypothetical protein